MLAGIIKAPSAVNPTTNLDRATERRNVVLGLMCEHGFIDPARAGRGGRRAGGAQRQPRREDTAGLHFKEIVRRELIERFGKEAVYQKRLRVYTTIDPDMQKAAEAAVVSSLRDIESRMASASTPRGIRRPHGNARRRAAAGIAGGARSRDRRSPRDCRRPRYVERWLEPRAAVETPAGIGLQAFRLRGSDRKRIFACQRSSIDSMSRSRPTRERGFPRMSTRRPTR